MLAKELADTSQNLQHFQQSIVPRVAWLEKNSRSSNQSAPNNDGLADEVNALLPRISQLEKSQN